MLIYITIIVPNLLRLSAIFSFCSYMGVTETILEDLGSLIIMYLFNVNAISVPNHYDLTRNELLFFYLFPFSKLVVLIVRVENY